MDQLENIVTTVANAAESVTDAICHFDLEKENINGVYTNLTLLSMVLVSLTKNRTCFERKQTFNKTYDYIIVGAGTAGSVMANRLSQKPCVSVLLLEAGGEQPILTDVPGYTSFFFHSQIDWAYNTTRQKYSACAQNGNRVILNSGKTLGGSSSLNAMLYVRGNKKNYDDWADGGATGWSYKDVFPYFLKLEDNHNIEELDPGYHRVGGPMSVEKPHYTPEIKNPILQAAKDFGFKQVDVNGRRQTGIYDLQATFRNQQRWSTNRAYIEPARSRPNLDVLTFAFARKILINKRKGKKIAYGVEFDHGGSIHTVRARKEVILSNGAIRTPQTLMLSGIGPKEHLKKFNIRVVADLPVGKNLMDHAANFLIYTLNDTITPVVGKLINPVNILDYVVNRTGPLSAPYQVTVMAFLDGLNTKMNSEDFPRQELYFGEFSVSNMTQVFNVREDVYDKVYKPYEGKPIFTCISQLLQPYSRGEITLNSLDPHDYPDINPNYYKDKRDVKTVVAGMKICNAIAKHPAMRQVDAKPITTVFPGCEKCVGNEDEYFACTTRKFVHTIWHLSGTARMGHRKDPRSVVDPQLRVIGVKGLRVISAAIFPIIPSANTNIPTMMVAEKAYDMMKDNMMCKGADTKPRKKKRPCHD